MTDVSNPQRRQIENRRKEQSKWRQRVRWKNLVKEHAHVPGVVCVHCGRTHGQPRLDKKGNQQVDKNGKLKVTYLTINHLNRSLYDNEELYCTWNEAEMEICCTTCNWYFETGWKPCPVCKIRYIHWRDFVCAGCWDKDHPIEAKKALEQRNKKALDSKALLKALEDKEKAKVKEWKLTHKKAEKICVDFEAKKSIPCRSISDCNSRKKILPEGVLSDRNWC